ncbi:MAG: hypothetical protein KC983_08330, partial [Phycisphaerales bacterium]|nr:hypothetical protein [Phycisphaerales bacterium]
MKIRCPRCTEIVPAKDLNLDSQLARCTACDELFSFAGQVAPLVRGPADAPRTTAPPLRPERITTSEIANGIEINRRWFSPFAIVLAFFCVFWDGFIVFWYWMLTVGPAGRSAPSGMSMFALLFPLMHVAAGIGLTWFTL